MLKDSSKDSDKPQAPVIPWNPWWGVFFVVGVYFVSQIISGLVVSLYPGTDWLADSVGAQFLYILLAETLTIGALYFFLKQYQLNFSAIGLHRPRWKDLTHGLAVVPLYFLSLVITVAAVSYFVPGLDVNQEQQLGFNDVAGTIPLLMTFVSLVVLPPFTEEVMTRGLLYSSLKKGLPLIGAVIATSLLFAAPHLLAGGEAGPLYIAAIDTFVLSLFLIYLREKTGSLWAPITLHAIKNGVAFVALFVLNIN